MDFQRAHEIISSKGVIDVEYQGKSVWLKGLNKQTQEAEIQFLENSSSPTTVSINELVEI